MSDTNKVCIVCTKPHDASQSITIRMEDPPKDYDKFHNPYEGEGTINFCPACANDVFAWIDRSQIIRALGNNLSSGHIRSKEKAISDKLSADISERRR